MSDFVNSLRFHGRFGNETEDEARMRRYRERCEAASRIEALEAELAECRAAQPAPIPAQTAEHPLEIYADSYDMMARMGEGKVHCSCVAVDIRQNMIPATISVRAGNALTEEAKDAAHKAEGHLKVARDALQRLEAALSVLHEDRDPIMAATITSVALVLDGDIEAAREAIDAAIASHIKAGQAGKEGS